MAETEKPASLSNPRISDDDHGLPDQAVGNISIVRYRKPDAKAPKVVVPIVRSDIMYSAIQVLHEGGENNLHAHTGMDGLWFVLKGRVRFYDKDNKVVGEFGEHEGVHIPRNVAYWFARVGEEPLEILQVEAIDRRVTNRRVDYEEKKASYVNVKSISGASQPA
jgi:mannose-6-phosphate isomerase-like protein (cupin superfamily)